MQHGHAERGEMEHHYTAEENGNLNPYLKTPGHHVTRLYYFTVKEHSRINPT